MAELTSSLDSKLDLSRSRRMQILIAVAIGTFMGPLDSSVVNIALPSISNYYSASLATVEWVVISYLLMISSLLLTYGRLGDMYGHKRIYTTGFVIFTIGSLLSALSSTILLLVIYRAIQAIGAGMMMSMGPAIVTSIAPPKERGKFMGIIAISVSVALATGPVLGGILTDHFGWQSIFYINIPIGIIGFLWANKVIPKTTSVKNKRFDLLGAVLLFITLITMLYSLNVTEKYGWSNVFIIGALVFSVVIFVFFVYVEKSVEEPMVDIGVFKNRLFLMGNISALLSFISMFFVIIIMPFYFQQLLQLSPKATGIMFIPMPLTSLIVAPISGIISDKVDTRYISSLGMGIMAFGLWQLSQLNAYSSTTSIVLAMMSVGLGSGMFQTPNNSAVMGSVPKHRLGIASSMLATMRNLGMVFGVAIAGAVFSSRYNHLYNQLLSDSISIEQAKIDAFTSSLHFTFVVAVSIALTSMLTSLVRGSTLQKDSYER